MSTPYELDIAMQPEAVLAQINNPLPEALRQLKLSDYDRIVLTGMALDWPLYFHTLFIT